RRPRPGSGPRPRAARSPGAPAWNVPAGGVQPLHGHRRPGGRAVPGGDPLDLGELGLRGGARDAELGPHPFARDPQRGPAACHEVRHVVRLTRGQVVGDDGGGGVTALGPAVRPAHVEVELRHGSSTRDLPRRRAEHYFNLRRLPNGVIRNNPLLLDLTQRDGSVTMILPAQDRGCAGRHNGIHTAVASSWTFAVPRGPWVRSASRTSSTSRAGPYFSAIVTTCAQVWPYHST